ncbi:MAG: hypothetical protein HQM12_17200 [SAR324 cluster bacterium]|nr:hypothetical protein [SAR324 cluster bacterium]
MKSLPKKCIVDTNVPITANKAVNPEKIPEDMLDCTLACIEAVEQVFKKGGLVLDSGDEIYDEYRKHLSFKGQPGMGDKFLKWVHDNRWKFPETDRVSITKQGESYAEFPEHEGLKSFDNSDRKFIAVSNAHPNKPPILQATDSKWLGWQKALGEVGITVHFLCQDYIQAKYRKQLGGMS